MNRYSSLLATRSFLFGMTALLCIMAGPAPAQETETAPATDPNQRYASCMTLARSDPAAAEGVALAWVAENGGAAAQHCHAISLIGLGRYQEAAELLERLARELPPDQSQTVADLFGQAAQAWMLAGGYDRAIADLDQSIQLAPYDFEFVIDRAVAKASGGLYWEAIDDLNNASEMAPGRTDILILRASAYRFLEATDLAMEDIVRVLEVEPQNAEAIFERGMLRVIAGSIDEARADWQQVVQLVPGSATAEAAQANLEATAPVPE
ncbi:MAG: tetratricopeptide repeat protein [Dongiaceae bacterium]